MATPEGKEHAPNNGEQGSSNQTHHTSRQLPRVPPTPSPAKRLLPVIPEIELPEADETSNTLPANGQPGEDGGGVKDGAKDIEYTFWSSRAKHSDSGVGMGSWGERARKIRKLPEISIPPPGSELGPLIPAPSPWSDRSSLPLPEHLHGPSMQLPQALPPRGLLPLPSKRYTSARLPRKLLHAPALPGFPPVPPLPEPSTSLGPNPNLKVRSKGSGPPPKLRLPDPPSSLDPDQKPRSKQPQRKAKMSEEQKRKLNELRRKKKAEQRNKDHGSILIHPLAVDKTTKDVSTNEIGNSNGSSGLEVTKTSVASPPKHTANAKDSTIKPTSGEESDKTGQVDSSKPTEARAMQPGLTKSTDPILWESWKDLCYLIDDLDLGNEILQCIAEAKPGSEEANISLELLHGLAHNPPLDWPLLATLATMVERLGKSKTDSSGEQTIPISEESQDLSVEMTDQNAGNEITVCDSSSKLDTDPNNTESVKAQDATVVGIPTVTAESGTVDLPEEHSAHAPEPLEDLSTKVDAPVPVPPRHSGPDHPNKTTSKTKSTQEVEEETAADISRKREKVAKAKERKKKKAAEEWEKKKKAEEIKQSIKEQRRIQQEKAAQTKTILKKPDDPPQQTDSDARGKEVKRPLLEQEPKRIDENRPSKDVENRVHGKVPRDNEQLMQSTTPKKHPDEDKSQVQHPGKKEAIPTKWKIIKPTEVLNIRKHLQVHRPPKPDFQWRQKSLDSKPRPGPQSNSKVQSGNELRVRKIQTARRQPSQGQAVRQPSHSEIQPTKPQPNRQVEAIRQLLHPGVPPSQPQPSSKREAVPQLSRSEIQPTQPQPNSQGQAARQPSHSEVQPTHPQPSLQGQADCQPSHPEIQPTDPQPSCQEQVVDQPSDSEILPSQPQPSIKQQAVPQPSHPETEPSRPKSKFRVKLPPQPEAVSQPEVVSQPEYQAQSLPVSKPGDSSTSPLPPGGSLQEVSPKPPVLEGGKSPAQEGGKGPMTNTRDVSHELYQNLQNDYRRLEDSYRNLSTQNKDLHDQNKDLHDQNKDLYTRNVQLSNQDKDSLIVIHQLESHNLHIRSEYDTLYDTYQRLLYDQQWQQTEMQGLGGVNRNPNPPGVVYSHGLPYHHGSTNPPMQGNPNLASQMGMGLNAGAPS